jgi:hypothetical protein
MAINQNNIVAVPPVEIDPNFYLPEGVTNVHYATIDTSGGGEPIEGPDGTMQVVMYDLITDIITPILGPPDLRPPDTCIVTSQTVRVASDGRFVVDVLLEIEDILGVADYDVRVTKGVA